MNRVIINQIPKSWYPVAFSHELPLKSVKAIQLGNQDLVMFRTSTNEICVFDAYCPHLGAHLGHGGVVQGDKIRCPFHGISYDNKGNCTHTNYSLQPLNAWPVQEKNNIIFVYYGRNPAWRLPDWDFCSEGWTKPETFSWKNLTIHPQNLLENAVDANHFGPIHNRPGSKFAAKLIVDGAILKSTISGKGVGGLFPGQNITVNYTIDFSVFGLGCYFTEAYVPTIGLRTRMQFLLTPITDNNLTFNAQTTVYKKLDKFKNSIIYKVLPKNLLFKLISKKIIGDVVQTVEEDIPVWNYRTHITKPPLAENEKEIGIFREWVNQFYS